MQEELEKDIEQKDMLYIEIRTKREGIDNLTGQLDKARRVFSELTERLGKARGVFTELVHKFNKLDRKIFEKTVGITKVGKRTKTSDKKVPRTLEELTSDERETLLAQLLAIQARRNRR